MIKAPGASISYRTLAQLVDVAHDAMFSLRLSDYAITYWNMGATRLYGWTAAEAIGKRPYELLDTQFGRPTQEIIDEVVRDGSWSGRLVQVHRDGRRLIVDARSVLQVDQAGKPVGIFQVNRDITAEQAAIERTIEQHVL